MLHINCDVGEGVENEELLMPFINACNIACGGHAGNDQTMREVILLAKKYQVDIGAHPSYPDREHFGRTSMEMHTDDFIKSMQQQIHDLEKIATETGAKICHIKPHGALYNDVAKSEQKAELFLKAMAPFKEKYDLYVPFDSVIEKLAKAHHFSIVYEAFADRNYNDDLSLVSRQKRKAVLTEIGEIIPHVSAMKNEQKVQTISGEKKALQATTFCVHSDTPKAVEIVQKLYQYFNQKETISKPEFPVWKPYGNRGILLTWEAEMSQNVLYSVLECQQKIIRNDTKVILDVIQSNNSLLIIYDNSKTNFKSLQHLLERWFLETSDDFGVRQQVCWEIPVCYDRKFGIDLEEIAQKKSLTINEIISIHTSSTYQVFSIGFLPGFLYLGGLDKRLHFPRKSTPRLKVEKGAVGIGGMQTGIYPKASPGGWQILGNSPINFFDVSSEKPCFATAGDLIKFKAISLERYDEILAEISEGSYQLKSTKI